MKKLLVLAAAGLLGSSLALAGNAPATAADPYVGSVKTHVKITTDGLYTHPPSKNKARVRIDVKVNAAGNADPTSGELDVQVFDAGGSPVSSQTLPYAGGRQRVDLGKLADDNYSLTVTYRAPDPDSIYKTSDATDFFTVGPAQAPAVVVNTAFARIF